MVCPMQKSTTPDHTSSAMTFRGKSGDYYRFQAWPMGTKFIATGGIYIVTRRVFEDKTFPTKASHHPLAIGHTADLAASFATRSETARLTERGANCICVYAVAEEARRIEIEQDLIDGNQQWGGELHYLFHLARVEPHTPKPPEAS